MKLPERLVWLVVIASVVAVVGYYQGRASKFERIAEEKSTLLVQCYAEHEELESDLVVGRGCTEELDECTEDVGHLQGEYTNVLVVADELSEDLSLCLDDCAGHLKTVLRECRDSQLRINSALGILDGLAEERKR